MSDIKKALEAIQEQIDGDEAGEDLEEIQLDNIEFEKFTPELNKKLESLKNLASLSLNTCKLKSLENFPNLKNLIRLELIDNNLPASTLSNIIKCTEIQSLSLGGNNIKTFADLEVLMRLPKLFQLDLISCEVSKLEKYRQKVFDLLPELGILDNHDKDGKEVEYDEDGEDDGDEEDDDEDDDEEEDDEEEEDYDEEDVDEDEEEDYDEEEESEPAPVKKRR